MRLTESTILWDCSPAEVAGLPAIRSAEDRGLTHLVSMMKRRLIRAIGFFVLGGLWSVPGMSHSLTRAECTEGGEFIRNAALARDNGISRAFFIDRLSEDLIVIQSFPPQLRWFVQDARDEKLLTGAVFDVFDAPVRPEQHEASFVAACLAAAASISDEQLDTFQSGDKGDEI